MRTLATVFCALALTVSGTLAGPLEDARELMEAERWDEAGATLERVAGDPALEARATQMLAELANRQGDYETGIRWGKQAVAADASSSNAHYQYAVAIRNKMQKVSKLRAMMSLGDYKKELARAIELDGNNIYARLEQIGFYLNAPGIAGGSVDKARELAKELQAIDWHRGTIELAQVEATAKNGAAAVALYREVIDKHPDDVGARYNLGYYLQLEKRWKEADAEFERLVAAEGDAGGAALYQRARTRILGEYDQKQALEFLERYLDEAAADANPSPSSAWWRKGNAYEQLGRIDEARAAYREALRLDGDNASAKKALKGLGKG